MEVAVFEPDALMHVRACLALTWGGLTELAFELGSEHAGGGKHDQVCVWGGLKHGTGLDTAGETSPSAKGGSEQAE